MSQKGVMLDTSFFIRLVDKTQPLHQSAQDYYRHFLEKDFELCISTIAIAEFCIEAPITDLPMNHLRVKPFNFFHALKTAEHAKYIFDLRKSNKSDFENRNIIPNDTKMFSQAEIEPEIYYYVSSDTSSKKIFDKIHGKFKLKYQFVDINTSCNETFGKLDFKESIGPVI